MRRERRERERKIEKLLGTQEGQEKERLQQVGFAGYREKTAAHCFRHNSPPRSPRLPWVSGRPPRPRPSVGGDPRAGCGPSNAEGHRLQGGGSTVLDEPHSNPVPCGQRPAALKPEGAGPPLCPPVTEKELEAQRGSGDLRALSGRRAPGRHRHLGPCRRRRLSRPPLAMSEELSAATSYTEDDFYCPVCQEVLKTPVRTAACQHVFCRKCFLTAMRESGIHCPLCRGSVTRRERACPERALDLENIMRKFSGSCRCCSKKIKFYRMRHHYKSCKKYQDEYGVSSGIQNFADKISQDSVRNSNRSETSTSDNTETYQENTSSSGHPTFKCPLCQESNFTRQRLLDHCNSNHLFQIVPVNLQLDEETQYQTAVEESFQVNI